MIGDDFDKVKNAVDIRQYLADLGYTVRGNRAQALWRGGKGFNVSITNDGRKWYDHKAGGGGTVLDLCMLVENCDVAAALHNLADRYGITLDDAKPATWHRAKPQPPGVSWLNVCIFAQYGTGETASEELRLNPDEERCYYALSRICGNERPIPQDLFEEALALVMRKYKEGVK